MKKVLFALGAAVTASFILLSFSVLVNHSSIFSAKDVRIVADGTPLPPAPPPPPPPKGSLRPMSATNSAAA